jgi:hypothetical protein
MADWRKSTKCDSGACIEIASGPLIRDSADPGGPVLEFTPAAWTAFTAAIRS